MLNLLQSGFTEGVSIVGSVLAPVNTVALCVMAFRAGRVVQRVDDIDERLNRIEDKCLGARVVVRGLACGDPV